MFETIVIIFVNMSLIGATLWVLKELYQISWNVHKIQNRTLYMNMEEHNDLNRFLEEFEQIKSELLPSQTQPQFKNSLFHNMELDNETSMNGLLFRINGVKYVTNSFSDYQKATKVIKEHHDYCVTNNMFSKWAKF